MDPENTRLCEISQSQEDRHLAAPLYEKPGVVTVIEAENRRVVAGLRERENGKLMLNQYRVSVWEDENFGEFQSGND